MRTTMLIGFIALLFIPAVLGLVFDKLFKRLGTTKPVAQASATDTEFVCEVVRITEVLPHPNADRLELAHFEMKGSGPSSYECVVQKGAYRVGDLAGYFSVDCIVPLDLTAFKFLGERLDGKGKTHYRLKAARLRGVFSQGLLVPVAEFSGLDVFGKQIAQDLGVTYHRPENEQDGEPGSSTSRNDRRINRNKQQPIPVYGVDSLKKLPRLFEDGEMVTVTEKIHGCNFRFGWIPRRVLGIRVGWQFVVGSHRVMKGGAGGAHWYKNPATGEPEDLWTHAARNMRLAERTAGYKGLVFYGELYGYTYSGGKIQDLTYGRGPDNGPGLAIFDVRRHYGGTWLNVGERLELLGAVGFDTVPVIHPSVPWSKDLLAIAEGKSMLDNKTIREGVVIESWPPSDRRKAKFVSQTYLLRKEAA